PSQGLPKGVVAVFGKAKTPALRCVRFSPDGLSLVAGGTDPVVRVWNVLTGQELGRFAKHETTVGSVSFAPDGRTVCSASIDGMVKLWDPATGQERSGFKAQRGPNGIHLAFAPDGRSLAVGSENGGALWSLDGQRLAALERAGWVAALAFAPDGQT